jgi:hypothetical protein
VFVDGQASTTDGRGRREGDGEGKVGRWPKLVYRALTRRQSPRCKHGTEVVGRRGSPDYVHGRQVRRWRYCGSLVETCVRCVALRCVALRCVGEGGTYVGCRGCDVNQYVISIEHRRKKKTHCVHVKG